MGDIVGILNVWGGFLSLQRGVGFRVVTGGASPSGAHKSVREIFFQRILEVGADFCVSNGGVGFREVAGAASRRGVYDSVCARDCHKDLVR